MDPVATMAPRVDRLLRSLVGVADLHMAWKADVLSDVHILRADRVQQHQLIRNIVSGLQAGFGIRLHPDHVHVHDTRALFDSALAGVRAPAAAGTGKAQAVTAAPAAAKTPPVKPAAAPAPAPVKPIEAVARPEKVRVQRARVPELVVEDGAVHVVAPTESDIELERIDVERNGPLLRCRVSLRNGPLKYSAIAEAPHSATAEAELAARVTLDALRAGSLTEAVMDGVGMLTLGETSYIVAAVREGSAVLPRASAAPLQDSMAWSAAVAVLNAVGRLVPVAATSRPVLSAG